MSWCLLALGTLALYLFCNNTGTRVILTVCILSPLLTSLFLYLPRQPVEAELDGPEQVCPGDRCELVLTLTHKRRLPVLLCGKLISENRMTGERAVLSFQRYLSGIGQSRFPFNLDTAHCGAIDVRTEDCLFTDMLGLFSRPCPIQAVHTVWALPQARPVSVTLAQTADFLTDSERYSASVPGYDPSETFRIREYQPGDPIRQIHWKLSEKTQRVYVREFGLPIVEQVLLLTELTVLPDCEVTSDDLDQILSGLCSVGTALLQEQIGFTAAWWDHSAQSLVYHRIQSGEDFSGALRQLLSSPLSPGNKSVCRAWSEEGLGCVFAHAAVFSASPQPDPDLLFHGNRVTVLTPLSRFRDSAPWSSCAAVLPLKDPLSDLEL